MRRHIVAGLVLGLTTFSAKWLVGKGLVEP